MPPPEANPVLDLVSEAARRLPPNRDYVGHLLVRAGPEGLVRLSANENTLPPSPRVREALAAAYDSVHLYPSPLHPLRATLAGELGVAPDRLLLGAGSTELIDALFRTFLAAGDEIIVPSPSWPVYARRALATAATVIDVPLIEGEERFEYDIARMLGSVGPQTKMIVLPSPNNPTGNAIPHAGIEACAETGKVVLVDEAYADFSRSGSQVSLVHRWSNVVVARTFSKSHALAGLRLGYLVGDATVLDYVDRLLVPGSSLSSVALDAALAALLDREFHQAHISRIRHERAFLTESAHALGCKAFASEGNFVLLAVPPRAGTALAVAQKLAGRGVLVRPVSDRLVRVSVGTREENQRFAEALREVL